MRDAQNGEDNGIPITFKEYLYKFAYQRIPQVPSEYWVKWTEVDKRILDALKMLKDVGLLDDMPSGATYVNSGNLASVMRRNVFIPSELGPADEQTLHNTTDVAMKIYARYLLPHILANAVYADELEEDLNDLGRDMVHAAQMALAEE